MSSWDITQYINPNTINPVYIKGELDKYVYGNDKAKEILAVSVLKRQIRFVLRWGQGLDLPNVSDKEIAKSNVMVLGGTGTGKTYMMNCIKKLFNIPVTIVDISEYTGSGYTGQDIQTLLIKVIQNTWNMYADKIDMPSDQFGLFLKNAIETSIIYVDEIDKIAKAVGGSGRDVRGSAVQEELLTLLENKETTLSDLHPHGKGMTAEEKHVEAAFLRAGLNSEISTKDITFVVGGAFPSLGDIVMQRTGGSEAGFHGKVLSKAAKDNLFHNVMPEDLVSFGMLQELIGRVPNIVSTDPVTVTSLYKILTETQGSVLGHYTNLFSLLGHKIRFTKGALTRICENAMARNTGARALTSIVSCTLTPLLYRHCEYNTEEIVVKAKDVRMSLCQE